VRGFMARVPEGTQHFALPSPLVQRLHKNTTECENFFGNRREQRDVFGMINHIKEELCIWGMAYAKGNAPASRE
jgi:hypothetical protein